MRESHSGRVFVDVTSAAGQVLLTGVQRVVRSLAGELRRKYGNEPLFAIWSERSQSYYRLRPIEESRLLRIFEKGWHRSPRGERIARLWRRRRLYWTSVRKTDRIQIEGEEIGEVWIPEIFSDGRASWWSECLGREREWRSTAFFHDALTLLNPEWSSSRRRDRFTDYLRTLASFDRVVSPSRTSADALKDFWGETSEEAKEVLVEAWPVSFQGKRQFSDLRIDRPSVLSVGTIEPRKNHLALLDAFTRIGKSGLKVRLHLIGRPVYPHATEVIAKFRQVRESGVELLWQERASDDELVAAYRSSWFTVYPSLAEGYGLPIDESLWHGCPVICSNDGAIGERAGHGGCFPTEVADSETIAVAAERLLTERETLVRLIRQARQRTFGTWESFVNKLLVSD